MSTVGHRHVLVDSDVIGDSTYFDAGLADLELHAGAVSKCCGGLLVDVQPAALNGPGIDASTASTWKPRPSG